jgi:hypothetical protein
MMDNIRYGGRSIDPQRNCVLEATSIDARAITLTGAND